MHLVFATSIVPDGAPATGYEIANAAIVDALGRAGIRVTVLGFTWPGKAPADPGNTVVLGSVDVRTDSASAPQKAAWLLRLCSRRHLRVGKLRAVSRGKFRAAASVEPSADIRNGLPLAVVQGLFDDKPSISSPTMSVPPAEKTPRRLPGLLRNLCTARGAPAQGRAPLCIGPCSRWPARPRRARRRSADPRHCRSSRRLEHAPARRGLRRDADAPGPGNRTDRPEWFLDKVVPHLPDDFRIAIAGSIPADLRSPHPGVAFVGRVADAIGFVLSGRVVPLISRAGSGVQLKTIETFELGLPAVATSRSLRGIGAVPVNCTVADDPIEFAHALERAARGAADVDGSRFRRDQLLALDRQLALGLRALGFHAERACA